MAHRLGDNARFLREVSRVGVVEIVRILERVRQHEGWVELAIDVDHAIEMVFVELQRIVAAVEEFDLGAEQFCRALGFVFAPGFYFFQRGARFFPGKLAFSTFAV